MASRRDPSGELADEPFPQTEPNLTSATETILLSAQQSAISTV